MKLLGGSVWTRGDAIALVSAILGVLAIVVGVLALPGAPRIWPPDAVASAASAPSTVARRVPRSQTISSNQVNFGCEETMSVQTPFIDLGRNPRDVVPAAKWEGVDNTKDLKQDVEPVDATERANAKVRGMGVHPRTRQGDGW